MNVQRLVVGSGVWKADFSRSQTSWTTEHSFMGDITGDQLNVGVDISAFVASVFDETGKSGFMNMTLSLSCGDVVWIEAARDEHGTDVLSVRHNAKTFPGGLTGEWVS